MPNTLATPVCELCASKPQLELVSERSLRTLFSTSLNDVDTIRAYRCPLCKAIFVVTEVTPDKSDLRGGSNAGMFVKR